MMDFDSNFLELLSEWFAAGDMLETAKRLREIAAKIRVRDINEEWLDDDDA